jgi:AcrR family transcriptional regulator
MILDAARRLFGELGYRGTTMRAVAERAGVDPALIYHYFANKADLFAASLHVPLTPTDIVDVVYADGPEHAGEALTSIFLEIWEQPLSRDAFLAQLRSLVDDSPSAALPEFIQEALVHPLAAHLDGPDPELRVELAAAHLVGIAIARYVAKLEPIASAPVDQIVRLVAPRIQAYVATGTAAR